MKENVQLFTSVYGHKIDFTIYFDVLSMDSAAGTGETKHVYYAGKKVSVNSFDPTFKIMEINMSIDVLTTNLSSQDAGELKDTLSHELSHIFDKGLHMNVEKKIRTGFDLIRSEGIARFSEFSRRSKQRYFSDKKRIDANEDRAYNRECIRYLCEHPIVDTATFGEFFKKYPAAVNEDVIWYYLGEYICFVIYFRFLASSDRFPNFKGVKFDYFKESFESDFYLDEKAMKFSRELIPFLSFRVVDTKKFFDIYFESAKILGINPIVTRGFMDYILSLANNRG